MKRKVFDLSNLLISMFETMRDDKKSAVKKYLETLTDETGIGLDEIANMVKECADSNSTLKNLWYRIIGNMQKRNQLTDHIV
jgi:hypothetical protein